MELDGTDEALWTAARAGDGDSFAELHKRHASAVYTYCFRATATVARAHDLASVVWLELWRCRARVQIFDGSLRPYALGVARNVVRNSRRSLDRHNTMLARLPRPMVAADHAERVTERVDAERRMASVIHAVRQLPRNELEAVEMVHWAGLDYQQAAAALGVNVGTVKSRASRGMARLRRLINAHEGAHSMFATQHFAHTRDRK